MTAKSWTTGPSASALHPFRSQRSQNFSILSKVAGGFWGPLCPGAAGHSPLKLPHNATVFEEVQESSLHSPSFRTVNKSFKCICWWCGLCWWNNTDDYPDRFVLIWLQSGAFLSRPWHVDLARVLHCYSLRLQRVKHEIYTRCLFVWFNSVFIGGWWRFGQHLSTCPLSVCSSRIKTKSSVTSDLSSCSLVHRHHCLRACFINVKRFKHLVCIHVMAG